MKVLTVLLLGLLWASAKAEIVLPEAAPPYYRVRYEPSKVAGDLVYGVSYTIWIPEGVEKLRGIIVHQHGCGEGACKAGQTAAFDLHWQALARKHQCALLGPSYEQPEKANCSLWCNPRNGSGKTYLKALEDLAKISNHPELTSIPWALWGHSGGAQWAGTMLLLHPERIAAVWLRSGSPQLLPASADGSYDPLEIPAVACQVPVMCNLGTKEGVTEKEGRFAKVWVSTEKFFREMREKGALIGVSIDPLSSHECGNQRYLAIPWFDACLTARLPEGNELGLQTMPEGEAWLAPLLGTIAQPKAAFTGDVKTSVWLPNEDLARKWMAYVKDTNVVDETPPPAPTTVTLVGNQLQWLAQADLESGLAGFVIQQNGKEIARLPDHPKNLFDRPNFQNNNYSDTPGQPLVKMTFTMQTPEPDAVYTVMAINTAGLTSALSSAVIAP